MPAKSSLKKALRNVDVTVLWPAFAVLALLFSSCEKNDDPVPLDPMVEMVLYDVRYGDHARQRYDIHLPAGRDTSTPVVVMLHGGAWSSGSKEELAPYVSLLRQKWPEVAVVNMNYRLAGTAEHFHHEHMMEDIRSVLAHVLDRQTYYSVSSRMAVGGASAGAQLAMIYAYRYNDFGNIRCVASFFGPTLINDWAWYDSYNIFLGRYIGDLLTDYVGIPWDSAAYAAVSPYSNVTQQSPPTIVFHGTLDPIVPVYHSRLLHERLNELGIPNEYYEYPAGHGFSPEQNNVAFTDLVVFLKSFLP